MQPCDWPRLPWRPPIANEQLLQRPVACGRNMADRLTQLQDAVNSVSHFSRLVSVGLSPEVNQGGKGAGEAEPRSGGQTGPWFGKTRSRRREAVPGRFEAGCGREQPLRLRSGESPPRDLTPPGLSCPPGTAFRSCQWCQGTGERGSRCFFLTTSSPRGCPCASRSHLCP